MAFTGRLASMTRGEAAELVRSRGGEFTRRLARGTDLLVIGQDGWPLKADGRLTAKLRRAQALKRAGSALSILSEEAFLAQLGLELRRTGIHRHYTTCQLARILGIPGSAIRSWARAGLVRPVREVHRLAYFEFRQAAGLARLRELIASGIRVERLRRSLRRLGEWLPGVEEPLERLSFLSREGRLLVRLEEGLLADPSGQLHFDFARPPGAPGAPPEPIAAIPSPEPRTPEEWLQLALRHEDQGRLPEALETYRQALLATGPRPELCFNLGNVLYALGRKEQAAERFLQAVEMDPWYVESWNNLGNALSDLKRWDEAISAYRRAIGAEPAYADAHYNLAEALLSAGLRAEAEAHFRAYLREDPHSAWADHVRKRLGAPR